MRDMDAMLMSAPRSSVLSVDNLDIMITSAPRRVNIIIMCKLITLIIREIVEDVHVPSEGTSDVDELVMSSTYTLEETHVYEESVSDVQDALVKSSIHALGETHVHEGEY